ncbi:MAG TPA: hypothetical protein VFJ16_17010 [Longimicrobium sp.]|nr:hypothetical protein [Longimicrobium sp.]
MWRVISAGTVFALTAIAAACETTGGALGTMEPPRNYTELRMTTRDESYHLSQSQHDLVRRGFDVNALERLLSHVPVSRREEILSSFLLSTNNEMHELWYIGDPGLQSILEEVWAPTWEHRTAAEIEADRTERPGKRLALARLRSR